MSKVTVVIPVYGVEKYIERCARSLFEQSLDDIEYIFVDDCTKDNSLSILYRVMEDYPHRKAQTLVLHHGTNMGLPRARQTGILYATGEYVIHCDSDDWVEKNMYEAMYLKAVEYNADIIICDLIQNEDKYERCVGANIKAKEDYQTGIFTKSVHCSTVNKLIRRELYENPITFPQENYAEDLALMGQLFYYAKKIVYYPRAFYHYRYNPNSISRQKGIEATLRAFKQSCENARVVEQFYLEKRINKNTKWAIDCMKSNERDRLIALTGNRIYYELWKKTFPEINCRLLINPYYSWKKKIRFVSVWMHLYPLYAKWRGLIPSR